MGNKARNRIPGEIIGIGDSIYMCVELNGSSGLICKTCHLNRILTSTGCFRIIGGCLPSERTDGKTVNFILENENK